MHRGHGKEELGGGGGGKARTGRGSRETLRPAAVAAAAVPSERWMRRRRLRRRQAWSARGPFFLVVAALGWVGASGAGCEYERITEEGDGSFQVPVDVRHTFNVPPADSACPEGERGKGRAEERRGPGAAID